MNENNLGKWLGQVTSCFLFSLKYSLFLYTVCLNNYTDDSGVFTSPGFPSLYPPNQKCIYKIVVGTSQQIALHFTNFSLEEGIGGQCVADYVEIK